MQPKIENVGLVAMAIVIAVGILFAIPRVDQYLKNKAVDDCGNRAKFERDDPDLRAKITYPLGDEYKACLKDKGYQASG